MFKRFVTAFTMGSGFIVWAVRLCNAQEMVTTFYDMSDKSFGVQAVAPPDTVRQLAVCKAIWFAEKKHVNRISFGDPDYQHPKVTPAQVPDGWSVLNATVYLTEINPSGNPMVNVAEKAAWCRSGWDWYR
jgi:hypothetical protein